MTRALLDLYGMPAGVHELVAREHGLEPEPAEPSRVVILEPAGRGECDSCRREAVPLYRSSPEDEGDWRDCEPCIRRRAATTIR